MDEKKEVALSSFKVQGWFLDIENAGLPVKHPKRKIRHGLQMLEIQATHAFGAAIIYARANSIPKKFWNDGTESPRVVIRVE